MCPYCAKTFKSSLNCKKHIKLHRTEFAIHLMNEQNKINADNRLNASEQPFCSKGSTNGVSLLEKNTNERPTTEPNGDSNTCLNIEYSEPSSVHQLADCPDEQTNSERREQPSVLNTTLPERQSLNCNVGIDGMRPFHCQVCGAAFKKSSHLKQVYIYIVFNHF